jgi:hypothetical protein
MKRSDIGGPNGRERLGECRAIVAAGLAKEVDAVNQYAAAIRASTMPFARHFR